MNLRALSRPSLIMRQNMDKLAYGFWGCYFGTTALMLAGSALAYARALHRIARNAALSAFASSFFVFAFLGGLPISDPDSLARFLAHVSLLVSAILAYQLFSILGLLSKPQARQRARLLLILVAAGGMAAGWLLPAGQSLGLGLAIAGWLGLVALGLALRSAYRGDRLAWTAVLGVFFMLLAMLGLGWIALARGQVPWQVHALSALAGTAYLATMASALWARYFYLIELQEIMAHGPSYDPVTRMRSHTETGLMMGDAFKRQRDQPAVLGVVVVTIGNLYALEKLHGMAAVNHALFVSAGRLRRTVPAQVEMGRFSEDGFLLLLRDFSDSGELIRLAHRVGARLSRSVLLNTSLDPGLHESGQTRWEAEIGVGVLMVADPATPVATALATGRAMSRTAMSYASRVAWFDQACGEAVELPVPEAA
jgi:GGDEF domain-containing protein